MPRQRFMVSLLLLAVVVQRSGEADAAVVAAASGARDDIQAAVDAAQPGDTITIPAGTFAFSGTVSIDKTLHVIGAGSSWTILSGQNPSSVGMFAVTADDVSVRDIAFYGQPQGSGAIQDYGLSFANTQGFVVSGCVFRDFGLAGISATGDDAQGVISSCAFIDIFRSEIANLGYGVLVVGSGEGNWLLPLDLGSERFVFVDEGKISPDSWTVYYDRESWWDRPTVRHGDGTNFSFADGHSDYWKWKDPRTIQLAEGQINTPAQPKNPDIRAVQKAAWGQFGYDPPPL